jgi:uroporphyrinogen decarboxylase
MVCRRELLKSAIAREGSSMIPLDMGSSPNTGITKIAYERLVTHLGVKSDEPIRIINKPFQLAHVDERILQVLHIDTRRVGGGTPDTSEAKELSDGKFMDEWGIVYRPAVSSGVLLYYDVISSPLTEGTLEKLERYAWPDPDDPGRTRGLRERATRANDQEGYLVVGHPGDTSIFENARDVRGMADFMMDLVRNKEYAHALLGKITDIQCAKMKHYLEAVGDYLDVICIGDDLCGQDRPLISQDTYREMVRPYYKRYFDTIKQNTQAKLHMHSCGTIQYFLNDLIELGVDIINPVQVSARGMDPQLLKQEFGHRITFWGAIDTQRLLPYGKPDEVRRRVRQTMRILGESGGYVLSAVHNIQADVPPENIVAMFDEAFKANEDQFRGLMG